MVRQHTRDIGDRAVPVRFHARGHGQDVSVPRPIAVPSYLKGTNISGNIISERDLNLIKNRLNHSVVSISDVKIPDDGWDLEVRQIKKGYDWLYDLWKSPTGKVRVNNPFGYRETNVLERDNFKDIKFIDFRDMANYYQASIGIKYYVPVYQVRGKDGSTFEYNMSGGEVEITG